MSEDRSVPSTLQARLSAKGASHACPMCRTEKWGLLRDFAGREQFAVTPNVLEPYAHVLICLNCGFVRWHVTEVLEAESQQAADQERGDE